MLPGSAICGSHLFSVPVSSSEKRGYQPQQPPHRAAWRNFTHSLLPGLALSMCWPHHDPIWQGSVSTFPEEETEAQSPATCPKPAPNPHMTSCPLGHLPGGPG